jgi:hypothetical protein
MSTSTKFIAGRFDAYYTMTGTPLTMANALRLPAYQFRAPNHAVISGRSVTLGASQAIMDAEILAAKAGGLSAWSFYFFGRNPGDAQYSPEMMIAFDLYQSSSIKVQMPWCAMYPLAQLGSPGNYSAQVAQLVTYMQQPHYFKLTGNRPVLYLYWTTGNFSWWGNDYVALKAAVDSVRSSAQAAGLGNPYVIVTNGAETAAYTGVGADAISAYNPPYPTTLKATYASLDATARAWWDTLKATGVPIVPCATAGWDRRPIIATPVSGQFTTQRPGVGLLQYCATATNAELQAHFKAAADYVTNNAAACPAGLVHIYAWNEHTEGGWLCPTKGDPNGGRLAALAAAIAQ